MAADVLSVIAQGLQSRHIALSDTTNLIREREREGESERQRCEFAVTGYSGDVLL